MKNRFDELFQKLKSEQRFLLSITFGVFLFVLFFQPFQPEISDFNNKLIFIAGFAAIVFITIVIFRIIMLSYFQDDPGLKRWHPAPTLLSNFLIVLLSSVALVFYLRYVGQVSITFIVTLKVTAICFATVIILAIYDSFEEIRTQNEVLIAQRKLMQKQLESYEDDMLNKSIEFTSDNSGENLSLLVKEIMLIKSADNYVEIVYKESQGFKKKLIRNTLKNIELQMKQYSNFTRCHRTCIVNTQFIKKLSRNSNGHWIALHDYNEQIPVSRQYLLRLKELI